jgi:hypothetical protein
MTASQDVHALLNILRVAFHGVVFYVLVVF